MNAPHHVTPLVLAQGSSTARDQIIGTAVLVVLAALIYWMAIWSGRRYVGRMTQKDFERGARARTLWTVLRRVIMLVVLALTTLYGFVIWDVGIAPFLAVGTVMAAAIGFGAQDLVKDFLSGFFILLEDQFHVGDTVSIAGATGTVEDIQLRVTKLRDFEGNAHFVPNGEITVASNFTSKFAQPVIDVGVSYETDIDAALEVFGDVLRGLADDAQFGPLITGEVEVLGVNSLDDSAVVLRGRLTTLADQRWAVRREALRRVKKCFDAEGITIPFPQITINRKD